MASSLEFNFKSNFSFQRSGGRYRGGLTSFSYYKVTKKNRENQGFSKLYVETIHPNVEIKPRFIYKKRGFGGLAPPKRPVPEHQPAGAGEAARSQAPT